MFQVRLKSHFLFPDLRNRLMVEENFSADLSKSVRGPSISVSVSTSIEETDVEADVEFLRSVSLWSCREVCGDTEREWAPSARGPACPSWLSLLSPSRWAWNVVVCCSRERKPSCTLSNCEEKESFQSWVVILNVCTVFEFQCTCSMFVWSSSSGQTDSLWLLTLFLIWVWLQANSWRKGQRTFLSEDRRKHSKRISFFTWGEIHLQSLCAVLQVSLAALQSVPVVPQDCKQILCQRHKSITNNNKRRGQFMALKKKWKTKDSCFCWREQLKVK